MLFVGDQEGKELQITAGVAEPGQKLNAIQQTG